MKDGSFRPGHLLRISSTNSKSLSSSSPMDFLCIRSKTSMTGKWCKSDRWRKLLPTGEHEVYEDSSVDWEWMGAYYYDKSIILLGDTMHQDQDESRAINHHLMTQLWEAPESAHGSDAPVRRLHSDRAMVRLRSDELIAATAILCGYEFMGATGAVWSRHLNGTKSLLDITGGSMMPVELPALNSVPSSPRRSPSKARKATFWEFARQDYLAACKLLSLGSSSNPQLMYHGHQRVSDSP